MNCSRGTGSPRPASPRPPDLSQVNKVHRVYTIARVAEMLGEDADWLAEVANEMEPEDGLIWVYGPSDDDNGVELARQICTAGISGVFA